MSDADPDFVTVDDADPSIQYSAGWLPLTSGGIIDGTKHGAADAGLTATFTFTGTQVVVGGPIGSVDVHGVPTTEYSIDGTRVDTFTAPVVAPGTYLKTQKYFTSDMLAPGEHVLTIKNMNGTRPNVFWLDYILYVPTTPSQGESSSPASPSTSTTTAGMTAGTVASPSHPSSLSTINSIDSASESHSISTGSTSLATGLPSGFLTQSLATSALLSRTASDPSPSFPSISNSVETQNAMGPSSSSNPSKGNSNVGYIVGGVIGGVSLLILTAFLVMCYRRLGTRRSQGTDTRHVNDIRPFGMWRETGELHGLSKTPIIISDSATSLTSPSSPLPAIASTPALDSELPQTVAEHQPGSMATVSRRWLSRSLGGTDRYRRRDTAAESVTSGLSGLSGSLPPPYTRS
ncbi:hypothetical protein C8Q80DRAFT_1125237 [Daedaleopsis nitida]|nr:hypothetical protein C8Q80DRAFT_1125237 [Daedaleopsis nitida]